MRNSSLFNNHVMRTHEKNVGESTLVLHLDAEERWAVYWNAGQLTSLQRIVICTGYEVWYLSKTGLKPHVSLIEPIVRAIIYEGCYYDLGMYFGLGEVEKMKKCMLDREFFGGRTWWIAVNCKNGYVGKILLRWINGRYLYVVSRINWWKLTKAMSDSEQRH